jgi:Fe-S-cluster containining protein
VASAPYYRSAQLRFGCTGCGDCCTGSSDDCVAVDREEQERIRAYLGLSRAWFRRRYVESVEGQFESLVGRPGGGCVFLDAEKRCGIYPVRPRQCRTYPFWPELVSSESAWRREARRCEGIGQGEIVPIARIEASLRLLRGR